MWVEVCGWDEFGSPVGAESDGPFVLVDESVVVSAEGDAVVAVGPAAVAPEHDVVDVAPAAWSITAGEGAAAVAEEDGCACGAGERSPGAAEVDWDTLAVEDDGEDLGFAGDAARDRGRQQRAGVELPDGDLAGEGVEVDGDVELRWCSAVVRQASGG